MKRKFFDIIPPGEKKKFPRIIKLKEETKKEKRNIFMNSRSVKSGKIEGFRRKKNTDMPVILKILFSSLFFLILAVIFSFFFFSKVKIEIWPETKISTFESNITLEIGKNKSDFESGIISAKAFKDLKTASKGFPASGKMMKEEKARGIIRVFNEYSTSVQGLLPNTRFVSDKGKLFRSLKREVVPGGYYEKGKFVAGFIDIEVTAAEPGEDYNINPSTFSIPGFKGTSKYTYFYGRSFSPMAGGFKGEVPQVTSEDIKKAESSLSNELKEESKNFLKKTVSTDYILLDRTIFQDITESNSSIKAGSEGESFNLQVKVESEGVGFRKLDMDEFIKEFISSNISENERFQEESLKVNYSLQIPSSLIESGADNILESGKIILATEIKAKIYQNIDLSEIRRALVGKSLKEVEIFLGDLPRVIKVEVESWPFLEKRIPDEIDKIELRLNLESSF